MEKPLAWKSGVGQPQTSPAANPRFAWQPSAEPRWFARVWRTPLGAPVDPEVYMASQGSSGAKPAWGLGAAVPRAPSFPSASSNVSALVASSASRLASAAARAAGRSRSSQSRRNGSQSATWAPSSGAERRVLSGTASTFAVCAARSQRTYSTQLPERNATRGGLPAHDSAAAAASAAARASTRASVSENESAASPQAIAGRSGVASARRASRSRRVSREASARAPSWSWKGGFVCLEASRPPSRVMGRAAYGNLGNRSKSGARFSRKASRPSFASSVV